MGNGCYILIVSIGVLYSLAGDTFSWNPNPFNIQATEFSHSRFKVTYPVPIQGWISQASKLQTCYKFQEFIFLGRQVILIIYAIITQLLH